MRTKYKITPVRGGWELRRVTRTPALYNTQQEAIAAAQALAQRQPRRIVWTGPDGRTAGWEGYRGCWRLAVKSTKTQRRLQLGLRALVREHVDARRGSQQPPPDRLRRAFMGAAPGRLDRARRP